MSLLMLNKSTYDVEPIPELMVIDKFKRIVSRDKSKDKKMAKKELAFIYFYADVKSEHFGKQDSDKLNDIKNELNLPKEWSVDDELKEAIDLYIEKNRSINSILYESAKISAIEMADYLKGTKGLLSERTEKGAAVTNISAIAGALTKVPQIMKDLNEAYKELVKEQLFSEGKKKGSKEFNMFEDMNL